MTVMLIRRIRPKKHIRRPVSRHLFVGGIADCTTDKDLRKAFEPYGIVLDVDRKSNYAFVKFFTLDMALNAKRAMQGKTIDGSVCKIGFGNTSPRSCLWIGRIGPWTNEKEIVDECSRFGKVERFEWPRGKNYAYVMFQRMVQARAAYNSMHGLSLGRQGKRVLLEYADPYEVDSTLHHDFNTAGVEEDYDETELKDSEYYDYEEEDTEYTRSRSPGSYDQDWYDKRENSHHREREREDDKEWHKEKNWKRDNYASQGQDWQSRRGKRGRGNWRSYEGGDHERGRDNYKERRESNEKDERRWERGNDRSYTRGNHRGFGRDDRRYHEREDRQSYDQQSRERDDRQNYDRRSGERNDRWGHDQRSGERNNRWSHERDNERYSEMDYQRGYERDRQRSPKQRSYGKRDRSASSERNYRRDERRSRSRSFERDDNKKFRRSRNRSSERGTPRFESDSRRSFDRSFEESSSNAVMLEPRVQPKHCPPLTTLYPPAGGSVPVHHPPPNPMGVLPQSSVVPAFPTPLPGSYPSSSMSFYPPVSQALPDFSVPPPTLRSFPGHVQRPLTTPGSLQSDLSDVPKDVVTSQFPVVWSGALVLKNSAFVTNMHLISGSVLLVDSLLRDKSANCPVLKITQRLRLDEPDKMREVERRVNASGRNGCSVLLAVPASAEVGDVNNVIQQRPLSSLGSYLREKSVAAVILLPPGCTAGSQTGILHAFPPCAFARDFLRREAPELAAEYPKDDRLLVIVMRETGEAAL